MNNDLKTFQLDNTKFIFKTNFAGDPSKDTFGNDAKKGNIIINNILLARDLLDAGVNVKTTKPGPHDDPETFVPKYYASIQLNFNSAMPPKVMMVDDEGNRTRLDEDNCGIIDEISIRRVRAVINIYTNKKTNKKSLYVRTMYVEQNIPDDPFAADYDSRRDDFDED